MLHHNTKTLRKKKKHKTAGPKGQDDVNNDEEFKCLWGVYFPALSQRIFSIYITADDSGRSANQAHMFGREARRYDYMIPRIACVISPDLVITRFDWLMM